MPPLALALLVFTKSKTSQRKTLNINAWHTLAHAYIHTHTHMQLHPMAVHQLHAPLSPPRTWSTSSSKEIERHRSCCLHLRQIQCDAQACAAWLQPPLVSVPAHRCTNLPRFYKGKKGTVTQSKKLYGTQLLPHPSTDPARKKTPTPGICDFNWQRLVTNKWWSSCLVSNAKKVKLTADRLKLSLFM
jgi:hypothetical protein